MPFDINTATAVDQQKDSPEPEPSNTGFDINTATPTSNTNSSSVLQLADKNMTIEHPAGMPDYQVTNALRDHVYGNDQTPSVPPEGQKPFVQGMMDKLQLGYSNGMSGMAKILGVDKTEFMKNILLNDQEKSALNSGTETPNAYKQFAYHFAEGAGGLLATLPLFAGTGEAAAGSLMARVPSVVANVISKIPNFAIGAGLFGAAKGAEDNASQGPTQAIKGATQGGAEALFWNTLYGKVGTGLSMFPKMIAINNAQATYEAMKQNRLPTTKELYTATADGIAYGTVFSLIPHLSSTSSDPGESNALNEASNQVNKAISDGDHAKAEQIYQDVLTNENIKPQTRQALQAVYDQTKEATQDQANKMMGLDKDGQNPNIETPQAAEDEGKTENGLPNTGIETPEAKAIENKLSSESGQLDVNAIPGVKPTTEAITKAADFVKRSQEMTPKAQEVEAGLNDLESQNKADEIEAYKFIEGLDSKGSDNSAVYKYADDLEVFGKSDKQLTPEQQASYEDNLKPLQKAADAEFAKARTNGFVVNKEGHLPRFVEGKGNIFDRLKSGIKSIQQGGLLTKTTGQFKNRVMNAIEDENGNRKVVAIKDGKITEWKNKKSNYLGAEKVQTHDDLKAAEIKPINDNIKKLNDEYGTLTKTSSRMKAAPERIRRIEAELVGAEQDKQAIEDKYEGKNADDRLFVDKDGKQWKIGDATTAEIEKNTNLTYHKNPYLNVMASYLKLRQINRATDFIENLKGDPDFKNIAVQYSDANRIPENWRGVNMPQFRGYAFDPRVADALDNFYKKIQSGGDDPLQVLSEVNKFLRAAIFYNPALHVPNLAVTWATDRGFSRWFIPTHYKTLVQTGLRAIDAVTHQNKDYIDWIKNGGNGAFFDASGKKIGDLILSKMGEELKANPELADNIAKALGYVNPKNLIKAVYDASGKATWWVDDVMNMQRDLERMNDNPKLSMKEAREQTAKFIPDYKIPSRIGPGPLKSKILADALRNPNTTMFGAYHYGLLKSYGNMVHSLIDAKNDPKGALETVDKLLMLGLISFAVYPALDNAVQHILGNDKASVRRFGLAALPDNTYHFVKGDKNLASYAMSEITPSPLLKSAIELGTNTKLPYGGSVTKASLFKDPKKFAGDMTQYAAQQVAPLSQAETITSGKRTVGETALGFIGVKSPHQNDEQAHADLRTKVLDSLSKGDEEPLQKAIDSGDLSEFQAEKLREEAQQTPLEREYKHLSLERVLTKADDEVDKMNDADKSSLKDMIDQKYSEIEDKQEESPNKIKKLGDLLDKFYTKHKMDSQ